MSRFQYLAVLGGCLLVTLPLELWIGARVYRQPARLARTLLVPLVVFFVWDAIAVHRGVWWFAARYTTGWRVPFRVPVEELTFFVVVPICALLTYEAVSRLQSRRG